MSVATIVPASQGPYCFNMRFYRELAVLYGNFDHLEKLLTSDHTVERTLRDACRMYEACITSGLAQRTPEWCTFLLGVDHRTGLPGAFTLSASIGLILFHPITPSQTKYTTGDCSYTGYNIAYKTCCVGETASLAGLVINAFGHGWVPAIPMHIHQMDHAARFFLPALAPTTPVVSGNTSPSSYIGPSTVSNTPRIEPLMPRMTAVRQLPPIVVFRAPVHPQTPAPSTAPVPVQAPATTLVQAMPVVEENEEQEAVDILRRMHEHKKRNHSQI